MQIMFVFKFLALKLINKLNLSHADYADNADKVSHRLHR